jgi:hypothetical protein
VGKRREYDTAIDEAIIEELLKENSLRYSELREGVVKALSRPGPSYETFGIHLKKMLRYKILEKTANGNRGYRLTGEAKARRRLDILGFHPKQHLYRLIISLLFLDVAKPLVPFEHKISDLESFLSEIGVTPHDLIVESVQNDPRESD